jgi:hypothetical protein
MLFSFGVCLADACDRSPKCFSHAQTVYEFFCVRYEASIFFYTRMGLMVAILPTHPRVCIDISPENIPFQARISPF